MEQLSKEWFSHRLGRVTASRISDVMAKTRSGPAASRKNYMAHLLCERLTGRQEDGYTNAAMQRGIDLEPVARMAYEMIEDVDVREIGFVDHPAIAMSGASPDGLVGAHGLLEIKCPNTAAHIDFLRSGQPDGRYILQMQWQMECTRRDWCDFVSFDDRMPEPLSYKCVRIEKDDKLIDSITGEVILFLQELDALEAELRGMMP